MQIDIHITLKAGVLDPQGKAIETALSHSGFSGVSGVTQGKYIQLTLDETDPRKAEELAKSMCEKLLANTVIEQYRVSVRA